MKKLGGQKLVTKILCSSLLVLFSASLLSAQDNARRIVKKVEAQYPSVLKKRGIGGTVRLKATVKADGTVKHIEVLGGNAILADSAQAAVYQWKFAEAPAESVVEVSVSFDPRS